MRFTLPNQIELFELICLFLGLFGTFYWTAKVISLTSSFYQAIPNYEETPNFVYFEYCVYFASGLP